MNFATIVFGHLAGAECTRALARGWLIVVRTLAAAALALLFVALLWIWWISALLDPWSVPVWWLQTTLTAAMMLSLIIAAVQAPAVLAGSLAGERERGVLQLLLTTTVTPREIVTGRLIGKLSQVGMILFAGLPILGILFSLNGLGFIDLLAFLLLITAVGFGGGGLAVGASIISRRGRDALLSVYILMLLLLLSPLLTWLGLPLEAGEWLLWFNPFFCVNRLAFDAERNPALAASVFWIAIGLAGVILAAYRLRPSCLAAGDTVKKSKRPRFVPLLGNRPMVWKELYIERVGTLGRFGRWLGVLLTVAFGGGSLVLGAVILSDLFWPSSDGWGVQAKNFLSVLLTGASATFLGWLIQWAIGLRAAVSIASERERATWDALLMSPLEPRELVLAKVLGSLHALRWLAAAILLAWTVGVVAGVISVHDYFFWIVGTLVNGALMAAIGVRASLSLPTATKAMTWTISLWLVSGAVLATCALALLALLWLMILTSWWTAVSYGYISPSATPWVNSMSWETVWPLTSDLVAGVFTALIVLDTAVRFDQIAGRMAGGAVATTVDDFLHSRRNQPVFLPTKKSAWGKAKALPGPDELVPSAHAAATAPAAEPPINQSLAVD